MNSIDAAVAMIDALEATTIPYMVVGSLSSNLYGIPRSTKDADFVVELRVGDLKRLMDQLGDEYSLERQAMFETLTGTIRRIIYVAGTEFTLEIFEVSEDPYDRSRFDRRVRLEIPDLDRAAWVPAAEDVIIMKSRWARSKDCDDIQGVIAVQGDAIDWAYVYHWADQHRTREVIDEIRASIPPMDDPSESTLSAPITFRRA